MAVPHLLLLRIRTQSFCPLRSSPPLLAAEALFCDKLLKKFRRALPR
jgi:hypothetical protein